MGTLEKYLASYAERETCLVPPLPPHTWDEAVVVPIHAEGTNVLDLLDSLARASRSKNLAILVINGRRDQDEAVHRTNHDLIQQLKNYPVIQGSNPLWFLAYAPRLDILLIDKASPGFRFQEKEGVGLARKIGSDLAVQLYLKGILKSACIHTTDADAIVDEDYFVFEQDPDVGAFLHPFRHDPNELPLQLYDRSLRYYVAGLKYAQSPYAFHTIGSTISFHAKAYAMVRGFPNTVAAEDFYFLNKMAKVAKIKELSEAGVLLTHRPSNRVPFGTGVAVTKIKKASNELKVYHPMSFELLRSWLTFCSELGGALPEAITPILERMGAFQALAIARATRRTCDDIRRHMHTWFDAFQTLKFIHAVRDELLPLVPISSQGSPALFSHHSPYGPVPAPLLHIFSSLTHNPD